MDESLLIAVERAMRSFGNSDASAVSELWSTTEDVTIFGAFGGHERGWEAVRPGWRGLPHSFAMARGRTSCSPPTSEPTWVTPFGSNIRRPASTAPTPFMIWICESLTYSVGSTVTGGWSTAMQTSSPRRPSPSARWNRSNRAARQARVVRVVRVVHSSDSP